MKGWEAEGERESNRWREQHDDNGTMEVGETDEEDYRYNVKDKLKYEWYLQNRCITSFAG